MITRIYSRFKLYCLLFLLVPLNLLSQTNTTELQSVADTAKTTPAGSPHSFYTGLGYGSNMIYLGSTISQDQPYGYTALTYGFKDEFFVSASAYHLTVFEPFVAFYNVSASYNHTFNSWFDISLGISGYRVTDVLADTLFSNFFYGDITLGFDWRLIYSKVSAGGLLSEESQAYFQIRNSRYFQTPEFIKDKAYFSFDPYVNLLLGTMVKVETIDGTTTTVSPGYRPWKSSSQSSTITRYTKTFGLMEVDFGLPVAFNYDFVTIEAEAAYVLPAYFDAGFPGMKGFIFMLSAFFRIF